jgi:hypothetical protein
LLQQGRALASLLLGIIDSCAPAASCCTKPALQAVDCYRKALQAADNNNSEYAAKVKALSKAIGKKVQIEKAQVRCSPTAQLQDPA